jgi:beta-glucanase (GH16 family)
MLGCATSPDAGNAVGAAGQVSSGGAAVASSGGASALAGNTSGGATSSAGASDTGGVANTAGGGSAGAATNGGDANAGASGAVGVAGAGGAAGASGALGTGGAAGASGAIGTGGAAGASGEIPGWTLVWRDEFDGPKGSPPDSSKWTPVVAPASSNMELEYYTARPENLALDGNGNLTITARSEAYMGLKYTSARIETVGKFEQAYGRWESRIKIPRGQGIWPAFWIMGNNADVGWPARGELDIEENRGKEPTISIGAMHGPGYSGSLDFRAQHVIAEGVWQNFHVFTCEWELNVVRWYVDGELFETRTPADLAARGGNLKWVYDHPFYIIMNVAVGGLFPGSPDATTPFPQALVADYVRVYKR